MAGGGVSAAIQGMGRGFRKRADVEWGTGAHKEGSGEHRCILGRKNE